MLLSFGRVIPFQFILLLLEGYLDAADEQLITFHLYTAWLLLVNQLLITKKGRDTAAGH